RDCLLHRLLDALDGVADRLRGVLHRADDLLLQALDLVRERGAGLFHLLTDYFGFVIHRTFSLIASTDWSGRGLNDRNRWTPTRTSTTPMTANTPPTMP